MTVATYLAKATILMWRGPAIPMGEMRCWMAGVNRNGTERFASSSPVREEYRVLQGRGIGVF